MNIFKRFSRVRADPRLTPTERDVVQMVYDNYSIEMILRERNWKRSTYDNHMRHIRRKTRLYSTNALIVWWHVQREIGNAYVEGGSKPDVSSASSR